MTIKEVAKATGMQVRTIREWIRNGKLKAVRGRYRYCISDEEVARVVGIRKAKNDNKD